MKFKTIFLILASWQLQCACVAQTSTNLIVNSVVSEPRSNIVVGFRSQLGRGFEVNKYRAPTFRSDTPIEFGFASVIDVPFDVVALKPQYGMVISARASDGSLVEYTSKGKIFGSKIAECNGWNKNQFDNSREQGNVRDASYMSVAGKSGQMIFSRHMAALDELFKLEKSGRYDVSIEVQCLVASYGKCNSNNFHIVRLPIVHLQVIKDENK